MERSFVQSLGSAALLALLTGCGGEPGVIEIRFPLRPVPVVEPMSVDAGLLAVLSLATGEVSAHVSEESGIVKVQGLPAPPADHDYAVVLVFAHEEREDLPGATGEAGHGHSHGALRQALGDEGEEPTVEAGLLVSGAEPGTWERPFSPSALGVPSLGALRAALIVLEPRDGSAPVMLLHGDVASVDTQASAGAEEGGHSHGA